MKKRSRKMDAGTVSGSHGQFDVVTRGRHPTVNTWAQGRPPLCRAAPAFFWQVGAVSTTGLPFQLHSCARDGRCTRITWRGSIPTPCSSWGQEGLDKGPTPSLPAGSYLVPLSGPATAPPFCRPKRPRPGATPEGGDSPTKDQDPQRRPHVGLFVGRAQGVPRVQRL